MTTILLMLTAAVLAIAVYRAVPAIYYSRRAERMIAAASPTQTATPRKS